MDTRMDTGVDSVAEAPDPAKADPTRIALTSHAQKSWVERAIGYVDEPATLFCAAALRVGHRVERSGESETEEVRVYRDFELVFEPVLDETRIEWLLVTILPKGVRRGDGS